MVAYLYRVWALPLSLATTQGITTITLQWKRQLVSYSTAKIMALLFSFPPGTKMFQFPGLSSYAYGFSV